MGSIAESLDLDNARALRLGGRGPVRDGAQQLLLLVGACSQPGPLLVVDRLALQLVEDLVYGGVEGRGAGGAPDRLAVDDQGHIHDVAALKAPVLLQGELHGGLAAVVQQPLQPAHLLLDVAPVYVADVQVLAFDDGAHVPLQVVPRSYTRGGSRLGAAQWIAA